MGSPLGLSSGKDSFKRGKANIRYNKVDKEWKPNSSQNYEQSLFNEGSSLAYFPSKSDPNSVSNMEREISGNESNPHGGEMGVRSNTNSIYDVRTQSIIDWTALQSKSMQLFARDFAYLRFLGVYPNNRLVVCRKFLNGVDNDLSKIKVAPVSTLLTWRAPGEEFFKISFGEEWTDVNETFTDIFNDIGKEFKLDKIGIELGEVLGGGAGGVPLPGFTETWQRRLLGPSGLKLIDEKGADIIPSGNPNLIKQAKRRKVIPDGQYSSGLKCDFSVEVKIEYEQKFIGGLDPTKAFYDILANISQFGTQDAVFFLNGAGESAKKFSDFVNKLRDNPRGALEDLMKVVIDQLKSVVNDIKKTFNRDEGSGDDSDKSEEDAKAESDEKIDENNSLIQKAIDGILSVLGGIVKKYEIRILGVVNMLVGNPSGPWHVTIGNPKRPIFSSGDMICDKVNVTLGETLAFNDLPSRITVDFTLTNARPLGLSEIMSRFMQGQGRTYVSGPSSWSESPSSIESVPPSNTNGTTPISSGTSSTPIGGRPIGDSSSDGSQNIGSVQSNESFASGSGQESTNGKDPDPDAIRNVNSVTDTPPPAVNDVKPVAPTNLNATPPDAKVDNSKKSMSDSSVSNSSNDDLTSRRGKIDDELDNTPETVTDSKGATSLNPERLKLEEEKRKINSELESREELGLYQK